MSKDDFEIAFIRERLEYKKLLRKNRDLQLQNQSTFMMSLMPYFGQFSAGMFNAQARVTPERRLIYSSALLHITWGLLAYGATKLFPDFVRFKPEQTISPEEAVVEGVNVGYVHSLARKKGNWAKACKEAQRDLVRGECFIWQGYGKNNQGNNVGLEWTHIPWGDVYYEYGDTDTIIAQDLSLYQLIHEYGEVILDKVTLGGIMSNKEDKVYIDRATITPYELNQQRIQRVIYIDPVRRIYRVFLGGNGYKYADLSNDRYPFMRENGVGFNPIKRRVFYPEAPGGSYCGYGPLDLLIPLARLENNIVNSSAIKAIKSANKMVLIETNDPEDASMKYDQYFSESITSDYQRPFFVSASPTGTQMKANIIEEGADNSNMQFWTQFILNQATMRTRLNYQSLTELASTAAQDEMKMDMEQSANKIVLNSNRDVDQEMATDDLYLLLNGNSKFHDLKVYLDRPASSFGGDVSLVSNNGKIVPKQEKVRVFLKSIKNPQFDVTPMVDGIFDNMSIQEISAMKGAVALFAGTKAGAKAGKLYADEVLPKAQITEEDFMQQQIPPVATGAELPQPTPNNIQQA